jgi:hypothetical protein
MFYLWNQSMSMPQMIHGRDPPIPMVSMVSMVDASQMRRRCVAPVPPWPNALWLPPQLQ